jgi:hypothetical protein
MKTKMLAVAAFALGASASMQVLAHHSFAAEFDGNDKLSLHGVVTKVDWTNPHTYIYIEVENDKGEVEEWGMEMGSPNGLMRRGWTRNTLEIGTEVIIEGSRARDGSLKGNAQTVILAATCQRMFAGTSQREFVEDEAQKVEGCTPSA